MTLPLPDAAFFQLHAMDSGVSREGLHFSSKVEQGRWYMKLREYKALNLARLSLLRRKLSRKYGHEAKEVVERLIVKTHDLNVHNLAQYLTSLLFLSKKYPELESLLPSTSDVDEMLREGD
ncbi:MAG: hypothetical protein N3D79_00010 [Acidilobaceae archaeon]|nr:hypothetical protein [Acidilobaceae archaeon]